MATSSEDKAAMRKSRSGHRPDRERGIGSLCLLFKREGQGISALTPWGGREVPPQAVRPWAYAFRPEGSETSGVFTVTRKLQFVNE